MASSSFFPFDFERVLQLEADVEVIFDGSSCRVP